jgi:hypothetical protein
MRRILPLLALTAAWLIPHAAQAAPYLPPAGKVLHGAAGGYSAGSIQDFGRLAGRRPTVYQYFFTPSWTRSDERSMRWQEGLLDVSRRAGVRTMFAVSTAQGGHRSSVVTPAGLAQGAGDGYLMRLGDAIEASGQVVYLRLMAEMNNWNNPYSAYGAGGASRGPAYSTRAFRRAWRRIALVIRGGDVVALDRRLRRLHMPPVRTDRAELARPRVALMWVPFCAGLPYVRGNGPGAYWPGGGYVDWVGTDFFAVSPNFPCLSRFYKDRRWRSKPFAFGEWALWGRDDPGFVRRLFGWIRGHRRVRLAAYNQGAAFKPLLRLRPRSAAELRRQLRNRRFAFQAGL